MFERFTDKGRKIIILAREEAERHQNDYLGTEHLVLAILRETDGIALMILKKMGLSTEQIRLEIERNLPGGGTTMTFGEIPFSPRVKKVIEYGVEEARLLGHNHIGSEHLLLGLLLQNQEYSLAPLPLLLQGPSGPALLSWHASASYLQ